MSAEKEQTDGRKDARRNPCGYRIQLACSNCVNCDREINRGIVTGFCTFHGFSVDLEHGICKTFDHIGKYQR